MIQANFEIVAESEEMRRLIHFARRVAGSEVSAILLRGDESESREPVEIPALPRRLAIEPERRGARECLNGCKIR